MKNSLLFGLYLSLLIVLSCIGPISKKSEDPKIDLNLNVISKKDTFSTGIKKESLNSNYLIYKVFDFDDNRWLENSWMLKRDAYQINGYKDYTYIHPYIIIDFLRYNKLDTIKKTCWALALGFEKSPLPIIKEVYFVLDYNKNSKSSSYSIKLEKTHSISTLEFEFNEDTILLYKVENEAALYTNGVLSTGISYEGEFLEPNPDIADRFVLGKPKYKLVRQK